MSSWRSKTFAALESAAESSARLWPLYSEFARLQSRGLRKQALATLEPFVEDLAARDWEARWAFASWLYGMVAGPHVVLSALAPHPLQQRVLVPTLKEAQQRSAAGPEPSLWLVQHHLRELYAPGDAPEADPAAGLLRRAIARFPSDGRLRRALADRLLSHVEYSAHHIGESVYLGDAAEDLSRLGEAREVLDPSDEENRHLLAELAHAEALVRSWQRWSSEGGVGDFPAWCRSQGLTGPAQPARVYYYPKP